MSARRLLPFAFLLAGCTVIHEEVGIHLSWDEDSFVEGRSHYRDVLRELGSPLRVSRYNDGMAFLYEYVFMREAQIGIDYDSAQWDASPAPVIESFKFAIGRANADREALVMIFDRAGILVTEEFVPWNQRLGSGAAIQLFFSVGSVVDVSEIRTAFDPNHWGAMLLRPLPQTLNTEQSIDDGRFGLEQRGTPRGAGQRTLEMRR